MDLSLEEILFLLFLIIFLLIFYLIFLIFSLKIYIFLITFYYLFLRVSRTGYASWEQGLAEPNAEDLRKLCVFYDITADELLEIDFYKDLIKKENEF